VYVTYLERIKQIGYYYIKQNTITVLCQLEIKLVTVTLMSKLVVSAYSQNDKPQNTESKEIFQVKDGKHHPNFT